MALPYRRPSMPTAPPICRNAGYAQNGQAGAVKDHATKTLPTLKMHYDMVLKLQTLA